MNRDERTERLREVAAVMVRLGFTAFGGPAAHVAMLREETVARRGWLTEAEFLDFFAVCSLLPGPTSTQTAIQLGARRAGTAGLWVAGICFITPAALLTLAFAWAYVRFGSLPQSGAFLAGVKPAVVGIVAVALAKLAKTAVRSPLLGLVAAACLGLYLAGAPPLALIGGSGVLGFLLRRVRSEREGLDGDGGNGWGLGPTPEAEASGYGASGRASSGRGETQGEAARSQPRVLDSSLSFHEVPSLDWASSRARLSWERVGVCVVCVAALGAVLGVLANSRGSGPGAIFAYFLKIGSILFGSGYVLLAFLRGDLVERLHWLTDRQLLDAIAVGQFTPGPLFSTATFIGYVVGGVPGAVAASLGIFLPSFALVWLTHGWIRRLRALPGSAGLLDGLNAGSVGLMAGVTVQLGAAALTGPAAWVVFLVALGLAAGTRVNSAWIVIGAGVAGLVLGRSV